MEFRFAVSKLKIPTVLAVVGTGYMWERSEVSSSSFFFSSEVCLQWICSLSIAILDSVPDQAICPSSLILYLKNVKDKKEKRKKKQ